MNEEIKNLKEAGGIARQVKAALGVESKEGGIAYDVIVLLSALSLVQGDDERAAVEDYLDDLESTIVAKIKEAKELARGEPELDGLYVLACI